MLQSLDICEYVCIYYKYIPMHVLCKKPDKTWLTHTHSFMHICTLYVCICMCVFFFLSLVLVCSVYSNPFLSFFLIHLNFTYTIWLFSHKTRFFACRSFQSWAGRARAHGRVVKMPLLIFIDILFVLNSVNCTHMYSYPNPNPCVCISTHTYMCVHINKKHTNIHIIHTYTLTRTHTHACFVLALANRTV